VKTKDFKKVSGKLTTKEHKSPVRPVGARSRVSKKGGKGIFSSNGKEGKEAPN